MTSLTEWGMYFRSGRLWARLSPEPANNTLSDNDYKYSPMREKSWANIGIATESDLCPFVPFTPCTLLFALCTKLVLCYYFITKGGQLWWALCLSGSPPLCVVAHSFHSCIVVLSRINLLSLSLSATAAEDAENETPFRCVPAHLHPWPHWPAVKFAHAVMSSL